MVLSVIDIRVEVFYIFSANRGAGVQRPSCKLVSPAVSVLIGSVDTLPV